MKKTLLAMVIGASLIAASAFGANAQTKSMTVKAHGRTFHVMMMKMDDGRTMYGMSKDEFERLIGRKIREQTL